ncbi:MAG: hypothetical protein AAB694_01480, partial [Patescibacteria group bacterium]
MKKFFVGLFLVAALLFVLLPQPKLSYQKPLWGFSYSPKYASSLDLDWRQSYIFLLDELKPPSVRVPLYWDETETTPRVFSFERLEFLLAEAYKRNIPVVLNVGYRVFRYPECHVPEWAKTFSQHELEDAERSYLSGVVLYLSETSLAASVEAIQIENE